MKVRARLNLERLDERVLLSALGPVPVSGPTLPTTVQVCGYAVGG